MTSSCAGEDRDASKRATKAESTSSFDPQRGHHCGSSLQNFAMSRAQLRFLTLMNSLSPSSASTVMTSSAELSPSSQRPIILQSALSTIVTKRSPTKLNHCRSNLPNPNQSNNCTHGRRDAPCSRAPHRARPPEHHRGRVAPRLPPTPVQTLSSPEDFATFPYGFHPVFSLRSS